MPASFKITYTAAPTVSAAAFLATVPKNIQKPLFSNAAMVFSVPNRTSTGAGTVVNSRAVRRRA